MRETGRDMLPWEGSREVHEIFSEQAIAQLKQEHPEATFLMAPAEVAGNEQGSCTSCNTCPHMKRNTLEKLYLCMKNRSPEIVLDEGIIERARVPIERMLAVG